MNHIDTFCSSFIDYPKQNQQRALKKAEVRCFTANLNAALKKRGVDLFVHDNIWQTKATCKFYSVVQSTLGRNKITFSSDPFTTESVYLKALQNQKFNKENAFLSLPLLIFQKILGYLIGHDLRDFLVASQHMRIIYRNSLFDLTQECLEVIPAIIKSRIAHIYQIPPENLLFEQVMGRQHFIPCSHVQLYRERMRYLMHIFDALHLCTEQKKDIVRLISFKVENICFYRLFHLFEDQRKLYEYLQLENYNFPYNSLTNTGWCFKVTTPISPKNLHIVNLNFSCNQFENFPEWIWLLTNLESLNFSNNKLSFLPPQISQLRKLKNLCIDYNYLSSLPENICELTSLQCLTINENRLIALPKGIGKMVSLKMIQVMGNLLSSLPDDIVLLPELFGLYVSGNKLTKLPEEIGRLHLSQFSLSDNLITQLPQSITNLTSIRYMDLSGNPLRRTFLEQISHWLWIYQLKRQSTHWPIAIHI